MNFKGVRKLRDPIFESVLCLPCEAYQAKQGTLPYMYAK
jgi:hypothetical protein